MSKSVMLPAFESIQSMLFPFMHDRVAGLHSWAAKRIVQIFLQLEDNFFDGRLVHVGAGFGGDMQEAYRQGIKQRIGLEKDPRQIALSSLLPTLSEVELLNYLTQDKVITTLYAPANAS